MKTLALKDLDESVQTLLSGLPEGEVLMIKDGPRTVARIERGSPGVSPAEMTAEERLRRHHAFVELMRSQPTLNLGKFNRNELYDEITK